MKTLVGTPDPDPQPQYRVDWFVPTTNTGTPDYLHVDLNPTTTITWSIR